MICFDFDFEMLNIYNEYIEDVVIESNLPKKVKKRMLDERCILKNKHNYYLEKGKYKIEFLTYNQWLLQFQRNKKLEHLGI